MAIPVMQVEFTYYYLSVSTRGEEAPLLQAGQSMPWHCEERSVTGRCSALPVRAC